MCPENRLMMLTISFETQGQHVSSCLAHCEASWKYSGKA